VSEVLDIGASRGIGLEFVRQHRAAGDRVIATARDAAALAHLRTVGAEALRVDVADPASISGLALKARFAFITGGMAEIGTVASAIPGSSA
jgi:short-subunit dehydrogenase